MFNFLRMFANLFAFVGWAFSTEASRAFVKAIILLKSGGFREKKQLEYIIPADILI